VSARNASGQGDGRRLLARLAERVVRVTSMGRQLQALWILAWSLLEVLVGRLWQAKPGVAQFRAHYGPDRLEPVAGDDRMVLLAASQCIACGRCSYSAARAAGPSRGFLSPAHVVVAASRSLPEYDVAVEALADATAAQLAACELDCPARVPFVALARAIRRHAALLPERGCAS
jgi:succinate dehydrogenase/fumarate reductase-like Fe-S protein